MICDRCQDLLWDELYGLLDASESQRVHRHLDTCSACQDAMHRAEAGQRLLARVARLDVNIPPFVLPTGEQAPAAEVNEPRILKVPRRRFVRIRPRWAAAAAILICLGLPYGIYQNGLSQRAEAYEQARREVDVLEAQARDLESWAHTELKSFQAASLARHLHLQILGPQVYQPGLLTQYRVVASGLDGQPRHVELVARLTEGDKILFEKSFSGAGEFSVALPSNLPARAHTQPTLEFNATGLGEEAKLQEKLTVLEARYITALTTDKDIYQPGDTIFLRSLTLEPFNLMPPGRRLHVTYTLRDTQNVPRQRMDGLIAEDGSGNGSFVVPADAKPGNYSVGVTHTRENRFNPVYRKIKVRPRQAAPLAESRVSAPMSTSAAKVELFPEGGALIAGISNRVYFRATDGTGPTDIVGRILDTQGRQISVVANKTNPTGLGIFTLTPQVGETYTLSVTSPAGMMPPVKLPAAVPEGVALSVPEGVVQEGMALPIVLQATGGERQLIVALSCRDSLVAEQAVTVKPGTITVSLTPAAGTRGVVRVMVLEARKEKLELVAERLVYCIPAQSLELGITTDKPSYKPGQRVALKIINRDEKRQPEQSWLLVSTGKRDALSQASGWFNDLPPYLGFSTGLGEPGDIELAYFFPGKEPRAQTALDLFLGTQGWTRVTSSGAGKRDAALPMFALDNGATAKKLYEDEIGSKLKAEQAALQAQVHDIENARSGLFAAGRDLEDYRLRAQGLARTALGTGAIATLALGALLLAVALVGMARGTVTYRRRLGGAFSLLVLCFVSLPVSNWLGSAVTPQFLDPQGLGNLRVPKIDLPELPSSKTEALPRTLFAPLSVGNTNPPSVGDQRPLPLQQFAFNLSRLPVGVTQPPDTLFWHPVLAQRGQAEVSFDLPREPGVYRVHVEGHGQSGRLGIAELTIDTRPVAK